MKEQLSMLRQIVGRFGIAEPVIDASPYGAGLINDTWLCSAGPIRYILQRLNPAVFPRPEQVMQNVATVTGHIVRRLRLQGDTDPDRTNLVLIPAHDGGSFHLDSGGLCWRMFRFIEDGEVFDTVQGSVHAFEVGRALGRFQALLSDLAADRLHENLPGFHHTPQYLQELRESVQVDAAGRVGGASRELAFAAERAELAPLLLSARERQGIPLRAVHNDPKVNNVLVHRVSGKALCMLDLDTVQQGIVLFDFGDCVRSAANPAGEDAADLDNVRFDRSCYDAVLAGYLEASAPFLTRMERDLLPLSVRVITFELGIRFLADHLRGDAYFRVRYPGHNLHRARVQFRLLERLEEAGL